MTITLLAPDGVAITAQQERQAKAPLNGGGFGRPLGGRSGFRVDVSSAALVSTTTTWTLKPCSVMLDPGATSHQGMYGWASDSDITGAVTAADATYARKDIVYIQVNDSTAGDGSGATSAPVLYLAGTPSATPAAPALPARSFLLGTITVPQAGGGSPTVALNTARFVAAGARLPVFSAADRPSSPFVGQEVTRLDRNNHIQSWNGSSWKWVSRPERYYADPATFSTTQNQSDKLIGSVTTAPVRSYATQVRVNGRLTVVCSAISAGTLQVRVCVSATVSTVAQAQARALLPFNAPGNYYDTRGAETDWIPVGAGGNPLARIWIAHVGGNVNEGATDNTAENHLWVEVLPADD
ncbi:minor tail protein [Arthrobacter phage Elesar]|uniref:Minor tail protein n=1 Tax=Arthrobacter phage Elesar TaxID=2510522 RepID=A0A411CQT0_9CAUD|nr:minor tail protein [Arthrobacter phage Elesar]QAY16073.1 minor tail protein [Arthrobacter phage Elesar]